MYSFYFLIYAPNYVGHPRTPSWPSYVTSRLGAHLESSLPPEYDLTIVSFLSLLPFSPHLLLTPRGFLCAKGISLSTWIFNNICSITSRALGSRRRRQQRALNLQMVTLPLLKMPGTYFSAWGQREHELALSLVAEQGRCQQVRALRAASLGQQNRHMGLSGAERECKPWLHLDLQVWRLSLTWATLSSLPRDVSIPSWAPCG